MANSALVNVFNSSNNLGQKLASLLLLESLSLYDVFEELASWSVFHDQEQLSRRLDNLTRMSTEIQTLTSYSWITFGCLTFFKILISRVTRSTSDLSLILSFSRILIATYSFVIVWVPMRTFPNVPWPSDRPSFRIKKQSGSLTDDIMTNCSVLSVGGLMGGGYFACFPEAISVGDASYITN